MSIDSGGQLQNKNLEQNLKYRRKCTVETVRTYVHFIVCKSGTAKVPPSATYLPDDVIAEVVKIYCGVELNAEDILEETKTEKRADKWDAFLRWSKGHLFEQFTTEQLAEECGFSYPTTLKYLQESPVFRKIKKGLWEVRDPKSDKEIDKAS